MDSQQCPHCGTQNDAGRALCANCQAPLTAYSGQLRGEKYEGKLASQVEQLEQRPIAVYAMAVMLGVIAVGWPLRAVVTSFLHRAQLNVDNTNYAQSAFGSIGPILVTIVCLPITAFLVWAAWASFTQQVRGWQCSFGAVAAFALYVAFQYSAYRGWALVWIGVSVCVMALWMLKPTRAWFGLT